MTDTTIDRLFDEWNNALQSGDVQRVVALYASDAMLLPTVSNQPRHNPTEIGDYFADFLKKQPVGTMVETNIRQFGDVAINSGLYTFALTEDGKVSNVPCRFTFVYRRADDGWTIVEHHSSRMPE